LTVARRDRAGTDDQLRWHIFGAIALTAIMAALGMVVNLYVTVPTHHTGADPSNYMTGSAESFAWSVSNGAVVLAMHTVLGLMLGFMVVRIAATAWGHTSRAVRYWLAAGALCILAAGFNGLSFLDFQSNANSLTMAILALAAIVSFAGGLYALSAPSRAG
jgi:hypothetical protein